MVAETHVTREYALSELGEQLPPLQESTANPPGPTAACLSGRSAGVVGPVLHRESPALGALARAPCHLCGFKGKPQAAPTKRKAFLAVGLSQRIWNPQKWPISFWFHFDTNYRSTPKWPRSLDLLKVKSPLDLKQGRFRFSGIQWALSLPTKKETPSNTPHVLSTKTQILI